MLLKIIAALWIGIVGFCSVGAGPAMADIKRVIVAGGCFWCVEADFESLPGVLEVETGFTGGHTRNPTYKAVARGNTGHYEAVRIRFDTSAISLEDILTLYFRSVDPTDAHGQFCDRGDRYRTAIFVRGRKERAVAEAARADAQAHLGQRIVTPILEAGRFYRATTARGQSCFHISVMSALFSRKGGLNGRAEICGIRCVVAAA
ncbi:MAG: peptide-methionine (S)-S-oxide reductase MsrA [Primorskyibacter sp.]